MGLTLKALLENMIPMYLFLVPKNRVTLNVKKDFMDAIRVTNFKLRRSFRLCGWLQHNYMNPSKQKEKEDESV